MPPRVSPSIRLAAVLGLLVTLVAVHLSLGQAADRARQDEPLLPRDETVYLPPTPVLRTLAFGRTTFMADLVWLRSISYFAIHFTGDKDFRWLEPLTEAVLDLDPEFRKAYEWAATAVMYGGTIDNTSVRTANRILERALQRFPDDWELHLQLGTNYYFELRTADSQRLREWKRIGAAHLESAADLPGAPGWLPLTVAAMHRRTGQQELAIRHLESVYLRVTDDGLRRQIADQLGALKSRHAMETLKAERERLDHAWKAAFPYMPQDLFVILGSPPDGRIERPWAPARAPSGDPDPDDG